MVMVSTKTVNSSESEGEYREDRSFRKLVLVSAGIHLLLLTVNFSHFFPSPDFQESDMEIETDISFDTSMLAAKDTVLPNAKESEKPGIPAEMLPQLPKKFEIDNPVKDEQPTEEQQLEKNETEGEKITDKLPEPEKEVVVKDDTNKIQLDDARIRLALERLRKEQKTAEIEAHKRDKLAALRSELASQAGKAGGSVDLNQSFGEYKKQLQIAVRRNFNLPDAYELKNANIQVIVAVVLDPRGNLSSISVAETSGNDVFDNLALEAINNSAPLPPPPKELAGKRVLFRVDPRTF